MKNKIHTNRIRFIALAFLLLTGSLKTLVAVNTVDISGSFVTETIVLSETTTNDGKIVYEGSGTVFGISGTQVALWWDATESKWFLALDGQPFWYNSDNTTLPNSTLLSGNWTQAEFSQGVVDAIIQGIGTNMPIQTSVTTTNNDIATIFSKGRSIYIHLNAEGKNTISVYELNGEKINELQTSDRKIQLTNLKRGTFIIKVQSIKGNSTQIVTN